MSVNVNYNFNFNFSGSTAASTGLWAGPSVGRADLLNRLDQVLTKFENVLGSFDSAFQGVARGGCYGGDFHILPAPIEEPNPWESSQPSGSLRVDNNKITTAGGYTIETLSATEWKITGPDGKSTRIWGDPHVHEGDREGGTAEGNGGWDFKRNSTFVLGDGTRINVTTVPGGAAGATVSGKLEVISGNDRVTVDDLDKGTGKFSAVTQDGYAHANSFQGDVFVQGDEADDWTLNGQEILGSKNQGESHITGDKMGVGRPTNPIFERGIDQLLNRFTTNLLTSLFTRALRNVFSNLFQPRFSLGANPLFGNTRPAWETGRGFNRNVYRQNLRTAFEDISKMFNILTRLSNLSDRLSTARSNSFFA